MTPLCAKRERPTAVPDVNKMKAFCFGELLDALPQLPYLLIIHQ
jgi:hypothetical protein